MRRLLDRLRFYMIWDIRWGATVGFLLALSALAVPVIAQEVGDTHPYEDVCNTCTSEVGGYWAFDEPTPNSIDPDPAPTPPVFAIEAGVMSPSDPTAAFGLIVGQGTTRSYSRFAYKADGTARQVETGIERVLFSHARFDIICRGTAGIIQDENNSSGTVGAQCGPSFKLPWGLGISALAEGGNAPVKDGVNKVGASLTLRWTPK